MGTIALLGALGLAAMGCSDDGPTEDGAAPTTQAPTTSASTTTTTAPTTTSMTSPTADPADPRIAVAIDLELVERLPRFDFYDGIVGDDPSFDNRFCDGTDAPTIPIGQARATYDIDDEENLTVAAYRFASGVAPLYATLYADAVRACALDASDPEDLGLLDTPAFAYELLTPDGEALLVTAVQDDVLWVMFQIRVDGRPIALEDGTIRTFIEAVEG